MTEVRVALVAVADRDTGVRLGRTLVDERIIACANVVEGVTSIYRWRGEVQEETELLLILKLDAARVPALLDRLPELHPYEVPEVLVLGVEAGHLPYMEWVARESSVEGESRG